MDFYTSVSETLGRKLSKQKPMVDTLEILDFDPMQVAPPFKKATCGSLEVCYDDEKHLYFVNRPDRVPLISVTTFVGLFEPAFDEYGMAMRCARKEHYNTNFLEKDGWELLSLEEKAARIADAWKKNNVSATSYGSASHAGQEHLAKVPHISNEDIMNLLKLGVWGADAVRPVISKQLVAIRKLLNSYRAAGYELVAEPVLTDPTIGMAGQSDLVLVHHGLKEIIILDYKTNSVAPDEKSGFGNMEGPFASFPNNPMTHYSIQLSTYGIMLKKMYPGYKLNHASLVWLNPNTGGYRLIRIDTDIWVPRMEELFEDMKRHDVFRRAYQIMKS